MQCAREGCLSDSAWSALTCENVVGRRSFAGSGWPRRGAPCVGGGGIYPFGGRGAASSGTRTVSEPLPRSSATRARATERWAKSLVRVADSGRMRCMKPAVPRDEPRPLEIPSVAPAPRCTGCGRGVRAAVDSVRAARCLVCATWPCPGDVVFYARIRRLQPHGPGGITGGPSPTWGAPPGNCEALVALGPAAQILPGGTGTHQPPVVAQSKISPLIRLTR